jgi:hypothetical protein
MANLTEFIRNHPDTPTPALAKLGREKGMKLKTKYIANIRWRDKLKGRIKVSKRAEGSGSDFIRKAEPTLTAPEVVAKAKKKGYSFSTALVYQVRHQGRKANGALVPRKTLQKAPKANGKPSFSPAEKEWLKRTMDLGVNRAKEVLAEFEARIQVQLNSLF